MNLPSWSLGHDLADGVVGLDKPGHAQRPGASPGLCHVSIRSCGLRACPLKTCWRLMRSMSALLPKAHISCGGLHVRFVPQGDISVSFDHLVGAGK